MCTCDPLLTPSLQPPIPLTYSIRRSHTNKLTHASAIPVALARMALWYVGVKMYIT